MKQTGFVYSENFSNHNTGASHPENDLRLKAITGIVVDLAKKHCDGRVVSILEGGYDLNGLSRCAASHLNGPMG